MAPFSLPLSNVSLPNTPLTVTQQGPFQPGNQNQWGPDSIGTVFFGILMFFMATIALWQGRQRARQRELDAEQSAPLLICRERGANYSSGNNDQGPRTADIRDSVRIPIADILGGIGDWSAVPVRVSEQRGGDQTDSEDEIDLSSVSRTGQNLPRTGTDWTLVGDEDDAGGKNPEDDYCL